MSVVSCVVCGTRFPARSDAVYCSSACRQKAHRVRTAERLAELSDRVKHSVGSRLTKKEVAASRQHVENVMRRSRDLCLTAAERVQQAQLGFQVVDVLLLGFQDLLEDPSGSDVAAGAHQLDAAAQQGHRLHLDL